MKCLCGCGQEVKPGNKYINGHNIPLNKGTKGLYKHSKEVRRKISKSKKGKKLNPLSEEHKRKISKSMKDNKNCLGIICSEGTKNKISIAQKGEKSHHWNGGNDRYWHNKAWQLFGKENCEICNISLLEYMKENDCRFDMHNCLEPKDYPVMEPEAWQCLCRNCHTSIEKKTIVGK